MRAEDEAEFTEFTVAVSHRLLRTAYAVCGDRQLAEDAVQSALISAYRSWRRVRDAKSSEAYLRKMVVNELLGWRRRKSWGMVSPLDNAEPSQASHESEVIEHQLIWLCCIGRSCGMAERSPPGSQIASASSSNAAGSR